MLDIAYMSITKSNITEMIPIISANLGNTNIAHTVRLMDRTLTADYHYNNLLLFDVSKREYPSIVMQA